MVKIHTKKGLDIPLKGAPPQSLNKEPLPPIPFQALDLSAFPPMNLSPLVLVGDSVLMGQPVLKDKDVSGRLFTAPVSGRVCEIRLGEKRRVLSIIFERKEDSSFFKHGYLNWDSKEGVLDALAKTGLLLHIKMRPLGILARQDLPPSRIFIKALESAPFLPDPEIELEGMQATLQYGIDLLNKLTPGRVHLVHKEGSSFFSALSSVQLHSCQGPHPISNSSLHIQRIDPIKTPSDIVWTLSALDLLSIAYFALHGKQFPTRIISLAGEGIVEKARGLYKVPLGASIKELTEGRLVEAVKVRMISGDLLTGREVCSTDFLGFGHLSLTVLLDQEQPRELLSFLKPGFDKYSSSKTFLSSFRKKLFSLTSDLKGEVRPFIDPSVYDKVTPLSISSVPLIKAVLANDVEKATLLGLLEVIGEDFALATFVCPSKIEIVKIIEEGLMKFSEEILPPPLNSGELGSATKR